MNITHPTQQSPLKRNGASAYVRQYLNAVSDWQTYAGIDPTRPQAIGNAVRRLTADYFSPAKLKGIALLLAAHLTQQAVSGLITALVRSVLRGAPLDTVRGIVIRRSEFHTRWNARRPAPLAAVAEMADSYYFHEGGRTWLAWTLSLQLWGEKRQLSALTLLSLPNRAFYFDRPLDYPQAVPLALGLVTADSVPGFLGDTNELDGLLPPLRALKLGLYLFNWLLIDSSERDTGLPAPTPYSDLIPPAGTSGNGYGYTAPATSYPPRNPGGFYGGYSTTPYPNGNGFPPQQAYPPYPNGGTPPYPPQYPNVNGVATPPPPPRPTALAEQPVAILVAVDGREQWHTITRHAFVLTAAGRETGLAITPVVELLADGRVVEHDTRWSITHLGSGRQLNRTPFPDRGTAQAVAATLLDVDWTRAVADIPPADLSRAQATLQRAGGRYVQ